MVVPDVKLTIGEVAALAGVTVRAVRHYHQRGLLPEPPRDRSGYRRYNAQAVLDLIRIKALAGAGVPLARVAELLHADGAEFAKAVDELDDDLQREIDRLQEHRRAIKRLGGGERIAVLPEVIEYLNRLRECGLSERIVAIERDGWLLLSARAPDLVPEWIAHKMESFDDPTFRDLYRAFDQAYDLEPGDPRLESLADELTAAFRHYVSTGRFDLGVDRIDERVVELLDAQTVGASPGWRHLASLLEARGWSGWTNVRNASPR